MYLKSVFVQLILLAVASCSFGCSYNKRSEPTVTQVTEPVNHGEGPHWDADTGALFFVDIASENVNRYVPATGEVTRAQFAGGGVSLVVPVKGSGTQKLLFSRGHDIVVVGWNHENATFDTSTNSNNLTLLATVETDSSKVGNRWNDGKADAKGRLWAGTMGPEPVVGQVTPNQAGFYLMDPQNGFSPESEISPVSISNGLAWNKDNTKLYYIDTATDQIDVFDFDLEKGTIANRQKFFNLEENGVAGHPDGMTIDSKGNLWAACFDGSQVINIDTTTGTLVQIVPIPASRVTSAMFGGPNLDILYVTTSRLGLSDEELQQQPLAGSVFAIEGLGVSALAPANDVDVSFQS